LSKVKKEKISFTLSGDIAKEIDERYRDMVSEAAKTGAPIPSKSELYEEVVKKGWEAVKRVKR
jgi:hypothetical protein